MPNEFLTSSRINSQFQHRIRRDETKLDILMYHFYIGKKFNKTPNY